MTKPRREPHRQARAEHTRRRLLEAAFTLLAQGGAAAVTHRAVAELAGTSLGATTYYFGAKQDLLVEVFEAHLAQVHERVGELLASTAHSPSTGLASFLESAVLDDRLGTLGTLELALERARSPKLRRRLHRPSKRSGAFARDLLQGLGSAKPEIDSALLIAALNGLKLEWLAEGERSAFAARIPELTQRLAELLLAGVAPQDGSASQGR